MKNFEPTAVIVGMAKAVLITDVVRMAAKKRVFVNIMSREAKVCRLL